ncbi:fosfomycin resistance protein FosB [Pigmentiphaga humi]|uniref:Fosfomycin resistance protein FosB n=1 Tax=Pigmentiphaga humi TaxID=2478468 RepID=A0A3P4B668_9BURK|nr:VOC family protein [Pigmentiphaga humi]VCU71016.1 fosfomycin resistance protein FosB [Pigmentiphaga humi]
MQATPQDIKPRITRTHLALFVADPFKSGPWYEDVLGMTETARGEKWVFLSFGVKHHDIALIRAESPDGAPLVRGQINMQHYGLEIDGDVDELRRLYGMLLRKNVEVFKTTDHKVGYGLYFHDPDGHRLEFFCHTVHDDEEGKRILHDYNAPSEPIDLQPL